jgi:hypothetical protein
VLPITGFEITRTFLLSWLETNIQVISLSEKRHGYNEVGSIKLEKQKHLFISLANTTVGL